MYTAWLAALATTQTRLARAMAVGTALGDSLQLVGEGCMVPVLVHLLPAQQHRWIRSVVELWCKAGSIAMAWLMQQTVCTAHA